jgi:8-oxo-dGTP diphosphatase
MNDREARALKTVGDVDWTTWKARDPATLVFVVRDGSILLIRKKRGLGAGKINGPGGRLNPGETPLECGIREAQEELHITPLGLRKGGENLFQFTDGYSIHVHVFTADDFLGEPTETEEAVPIWAPVTDIPYGEMWEDDVLWIPLLLSGTAFEGRYIFDGDNMLDHDLRILR